MKNKALCLLLAVVLLTGCQIIPQDGQTETVDAGAEIKTVPEAETELPQTESETEPGVETEAETQPPRDHTSLDCRAVEKWKRVGIAWPGPDATVAVDIPEDWMLKRYDDRTYIFLCDGYDIGDIRLGDPSTALKIERSETHIRGGVELCYQVRRVREGQGEGFRRVFGLFFESGGMEYSAYIEVDYEALDDAAAEYICRGFGEGHRNDAVRVSLEGGNASRTILVAGNSFVRTSGVGVFLTQFVQNGNQPYEVEWISTSSVTVVHYLQDEWIERIRSGEFHAIAMCGLYYASNVRDLVRLVEACRASDTRLVMFPAYNESYEQVEAAVAAYPGLTVVHWKREINRFIEAGMDRYEFCLRDSYLHSKPLAGYVGAHMLYMTFFDDIPPLYEGNDPLDMNTVRAKLGESYIRTGVAPGESISTVVAFPDGKGE